MKKQLHVADLEKVEPLESVTEPDEVAVEMLEEKEDIWAEVGACKRCANLLDIEKCIRIVPVTERPYKHLIGCALTCAPAGDRLEPRLPVCSL
jgi:hypothetical protein